MKINWSAVRNKMLLGEQLLDKVQVVAVFRGGRGEGLRERKLQNSGHNIKYLDWFFTLAPDVPPRYSCNS